MQANQMYTHAANLAAIAANLAAIPITLDDLHDVESLAAQHPKVLSVQTLRWQLRHRDTNGLAPACVPSGKKILLSGRRYEAWLSTRAGVPA